MNPTLSPSPKITRLAPWGLALLLGLSAAACGSQAERETPEVGLRAWLAAVRSGDAEGMWKRTSLRSRSEALAVASLSPDTPEPWKSAIMGDRLQLNWDIVELKEVPGTGGADRVEYEVVGADRTSGKRVARVTLVREEGRWNVDLPPPPGIERSDDAPSGSGATAAPASASASSAPATAASGGSGGPESAGTGAK